MEQLKADLAADDLSAARAAVAREDFDGATAKASGAKGKAETVAGGVDRATARYHELVEKNRPWYLRL